MQRKDKGKRIGGHRRADGDRRGQGRAAYTSASTGFRKQSHAAKTRSKWLSFPAVGGWLLSSVWA